ncbi:MAG: MobA/MobL family protein, partial [Bacteroidales bacterium]|nr:MobA/MobL family protein [Bacteroidales bacterium]
MGSNQYHLHLETLSRTKGRSSVQFAAYISGSILKDKRYGVVHDETSKEEVRNATIYLPDSAPDSWKKELKECGNDKEKLRCFREKLWNNLEAFEIRNDAAIGKSFDAAYPLELTEEQRNICREETAKMFTSLGYVVDFADHMVEHNPHLQGIISVRQMINNEEAPWAPIKEVKAYVCECEKTGHRKTFKTVKELEEYNSKPGNDIYSRVPVIDKTTGKQKLARRNEKVWLKKNVSDNPINKTYNLIKWRKEWEKIVNQFLPEDRKQTCLSYEARGINRIPKK